MSNEVLTTKNGGIYNMDSGSITASPITDLDITNKKYVDDKFKNSNGEVIQITDSKLTFANVTSLDFGNIPISNFNYQNANSSQACTILNTTAIDSAGLFLHGKVGHIRIVFKNIGSSTATTGNAVQLPDGLRIFGSSQAKTPYLNIYAVGNYVQLLQYIGQNASLVETLPIIIE